MVNRPTTVVVFLRHIESYPLLAWSSSSTIDVHIQYAPQEQLATYTLVEENQFPALSWIVNVCAKRWNLQG